MGLLSNELLQVMLWLTQVQTGLGSPSLSSLQVHLISLPMTSSPRAWGPGKGWRIKFKRGISRFIKTLFFN